MLDRCLAPDCEQGGFGYDNMTVILVVLLQNRSLKEYQELLASTIQTTTEHGDQIKLDKELEQLSVITLPENVEDNFLTPSQSPSLEGRLNCMFLFLTYYLILFYISFLN